MPMQHEMANIRHNTLALSARCAIRQLTAPIIVGTVGGVTTLHPTAKLCLRLMGIESANHLSQIIK